MNLLSEVYVLGFRTAGQIKRAVMLLHLLLQHIEVVPPILEHIIVQSES